jgi:hypothetical protein
MAEGLITVTNNALSISLLELNTLNGLSTG